MVQELMKQRTAAFEAHEFDFNGMNEFTYKVVCEKTGQRFKRGKGNGEWKSWDCYIRNCPYKADCHSRTIPEPAMRQACKRALDINEYDPELVKDELQKIFIGKDKKLRLQLADGSEYEDVFYEYEDTFRPEKKYQFSIKDRMVCGICGKPYQYRKSHNRGIAHTRWFCDLDGHNTAINESVLRWRIAQALGWDDFSYERLEAEVEKIIMDRPEHMTIRLYDGTAAEAEYFPCKERRKIRGEKDNENTGDEDKIQRTETGRK